MIIILCPALPGTIQTRWTKAAFLLHVFPAQLGVENQVTELKQRNYLLGEGGREAGRRVSVIPSDSKRRSGRGEREGTEEGLLK